MAPKKSVAAKTKTLRRGKAATGSGGESTSARRVTRSDMPQATGGSRVAKRVRGDLSAATGSLEHGEPGKSRRSESTQDPVRVDATGTDGDMSDSVLKPKGRENDEVQHVRQGKRDAKTVDRASRTRSPAPALATRRELRLRDGSADSVCALSVESGEDERHILSPVPPTREDRCRVEKRRVAVEPRSNSPYRCTGADFLPREIPMTRAEGGKSRDEGSRWSESVGNPEEGGALEPALRRSRWSPFVPTSRRVPARLNAGTSGYADEPTDQPTRAGKEPAGDDSSAAPASRRPVSRSFGADSTSKRRSLSAETIAEGRRPRLLDNSITVPRFDGTGDLEVFLRRFMSIAAHCGWNEPEKLFRLEHCISDGAQCVLMDTAPARTFDEFVGTLRSRFGFVSNAEYYRAELSRLRRGTSSIHELYLEVRRLVNKAFPGQWSKATEVYARDAFLKSMNDESLRRRVLMTLPPPETLAETYDLAVRAITLDDDRHVGATESSPEDRRRGNKQYRSRVLAAPTSEETPAQSSEVVALQREVAALRSESEVAKLQEQMAELRAELKRMTSNSAAVSGTQAAAGSLGAAGSSSTNFYGRPRTGQRSSTHVVCWNCQKVGHVSRECPQPSKKMSGTAGQLPQQSKANVLSMEGRIQIKTYMEITYQGKKYRALLDTGCDLSIMSSRILPNLSYKASQQRMLAANLSPVPVLGTTLVEFAVAGHELQHEFQVSEAVEEIIFGSDWLVSNLCYWNFGRGILNIGIVDPPIEVTLLNGGHRDCVRRLYAKDTVELPPRSQGLIAVKSVWSTLPPTSVDWMVEPKELHSGVIVARTLLANDEETSYVRAVNCGLSPHVVLEGELVASAEVIDSVQPEAMPMTSLPEMGIGHVQCLIDTLPTELTAEQRHKAVDLIRTYAQCLTDRQ